jgi:recombinational DNA repair protein RecT
MGQKTVLKRLLTKYAPKSLEMQQMAIFDQSVVKGNIENLNDAVAEYADNPKGANAEAPTDYQEVEEQEAVVVEPTPVAEAPKEDLKPNDSDFDF